MPVDSASRRATHTLAGTTRLMRTIRRYHHARTEVRKLGITVQLAVARQRVNLLAGAAPGSAAPG